jgi:hypothetical protein
MSPSDIQVGKTYVNRGKGRTRRKVLEISRDIQPTWYSFRKVPDDPGVRFVDDKGHIAKLWLCSFASWAGREANADEEITGSGSGGIVWHCVS